MNHGLADTSLFIARETERAHAVDAVPDLLGLPLVTLGRGFDGVTDLGVDVVRV